MCLTGRGDKAARGGGVEGGSEGLQGVAIIMILCPYISSPPRHVTKIFLNSNFTFFLEKL